MPDYENVIKSHESSGLVVSIISCWEVAKLIEKKRLSFPIPTEDWIRQALVYPGIQLLDLTPRIAIESTQLPDNFHKDPADQIIVATARILDIPLVTYDIEIRGYSHVKLLP
jgi:PIN domain nuclease of toxin-antitoxin system